MSQLDLSTSVFLQTISKHTMKSGTEQRALLAWFLENYYRLEGDDIYDCICDGKSDKGIDGIYVNEQLNQIDIFQATLTQTDGKHVGDSKLKEFAASVDQFRTSETARMVYSSTKNIELKSIFENKKLIDKVARGFEVRAIFVTNANRDYNTVDYLKTNPSLILFDGVELQNNYISPFKTDPISTEIKFDISNTSHIEWVIDGNAKMVVAPISGEELVSMSGISNGELFAWNVRQFLGKKTTVNKQVADSIKNSSEHKFFPAFHNGITILCKELNSTDDAVTISGYAVVNGCQSLTSLYENRAKITSDLRIMTKFIQVETDTELAKKITDHTNNQNGIRPRDLQSLSNTQTNLQSLVEQKFNGEYLYRIKRGEFPEWDKDKAIDNELIAKALLAFDLKRPQDCHLKERMFDNMHSEIFARPQVDAYRIVFLFDLYNIIKGKLDLLMNKFFAGYSQTTWVILYLIREVLYQDNLGKELCDNPAKFMKDANEIKKLLNCLEEVTAMVISLLDGEETRRNDPIGTFNYKNELRNKEIISSIRAAIVPFYLHACRSKLTKPFSLLWGQPDNLFADRQ